MTDDEKYWHEDARDNGWILPPSAPRWKRLPIIRRLRVARYRAKIQEHYSSGIGSIGLPTGYDNWVLYAIDRGWC